MEKSQDIFFAKIMKAVGKHPNSKASRSVYDFEANKNHKNLAILLEELSEHPEFSTDVSFSLIYYLNTLEQLPDDTSLSEAGLILYYSSLIYGKRVECIHQAVERMIFSLMDCEFKEQEGFSGVDGAHSREKEWRLLAENLNSLGGAIKDGPKWRKYWKDLASISTKNIIHNGTKRARKRPLEQLTGSYEIEMFVKPFKRLTPDKRLERSDNNPFKRTLMQMETYFPTKSFSHPTIWEHAIIPDFENTDEFDNKKNYKLFSYHFDHRYNSLIPDVDFQEYYRMKDMIDVDSGNSITWTSTTENSEIIISKVSHVSQSEVSANFIRSGMNGTEIQDKIINVQNENLYNSENSLNSESIRPDSGIFISYEDEVIAANSATSHIKMVTAVDTTTDTEVGLNGNTSNIEIFTTSQEKEATANDTTLLRSNSGIDVDLGNISIIMSDVEVLFSDLNEMEERPLIPSISAGDVSLLTLTSDQSEKAAKGVESVKTVLNIKEPQRREIISLPVFQNQKSNCPPLNILKLPLKYFKQKSIFKLGPEYDLLKRERFKRSRARKKNPLYPSQLVPMRSDLEVFISPPPSPAEFLGFDEKSRTLSRDSGISSVHAELSIEGQDNSFDSKDFVLIEPNEFNQMGEDQTKETVCQRHAKKADHNEQREVVGGINVSNGSDNKNGASVDILQTTSVSENICNTKTSTKPVISIENACSTTIDKTCNMSKIQAWHEHLRPILAHSKERHHFNVFNLGTEVMDHFNEDDKETKKVTLASVMDNKDGSLISRYFLSTLLLANQGNIRINVQNKSAEKPSLLSDIFLDLVTRKRNKVSIEDNVGIVDSISKDVHERPMQEVSCSNIRTLRPVLSTPISFDRDSGISMSDCLSLT